MESLIVNSERVSAIINLNNIYNNMVNVRKLLKKDVKLMAVIKADAYGHGAVQTARKLNNIVDAYGIAIIEEGIELRNAGIDKPILILGYTNEEYFSDIIKYDISQTVFTLEMAEKLNQEAMNQRKKAKIHLKIDTGMSRIGFADNDESVEIISTISKMPAIEIEGIFTHFAKADEADKEPTFKQYNRLTDFIKKINERGIYPEICHASNSAAIIDLPEMNLDMVRCGIITYGLYPSDEVNKNRIKLLPAMELKSHVSYVKIIEKGCQVSYNGTFTAEKTMKIATIPVGYADGYPRTLSSKGRVLIHGKSARILGRICMDQFMVDVTDIDDVKQGDCVTLVGNDNGAFISVEEVAGMAESFNYEFVCTVGKRVPRVYIGE